MKNSLGGNSKTVVVLCVSPIHSQVEQSISTLRFGLNAKQIKNKVKSNSYETSNLGELKRQLREYETKIEHLEIERLKERNQNEELIDMIKKIQSQKRDLIDKLKFQKEDSLQKGILEQTEKLGDEIDQILHKSTELPAIIEDTLLTSAQKHKADLHKLRKVNHRLCYLLSKYKSKAKGFVSELKSADGFLVSILSDPRFFEKLADSTLDNLKKSFAQALESVNEQIITRRVRQRLVSSLRENPVDIVTTNIVSLDESQTREAGEPRLGKREPRLESGYLPELSIKKLLCTEVLNSREINDEAIVPKSLRRKLNLAELSPLASHRESARKLVDCTLDSKPVSEVDLLEDNFDFNMGMLEDKGADLQIIESKEAWEQLSGHKSQPRARAPQSEVSIIPVVEVGCEPGLEPQKSGPGANPFLREPLADKTHSNSTAKLDWVSPASHKSSLYYFTSKKNEYDFSFDRSAVQIARNLGKELFLQGLSKHKENFPLN